MKVGDRFIRYSKTEPTLMGTVEKTWSNYSYDLTHRVKVEKTMIKSTCGRVFEARECLLIISDIPFSFWSRLRQMFNK